MIKIAIIGGGASGMLSAITARKSGADVTVFEKLDRVGKKLLSTGNGRCNITNENVLETDDNGKLSHYFGENSDFAKFAITQFDNNDLLGFFGDLGVLFRQENDKFYPYSETASTVLDVLRLYCDKIGVKTVTATQISVVKPHKNGFLVGDIRFDKVIVACGGMSCPHLGTDGDGYAILQSFGHTRTKLKPAITQVKTDNKFTRQLKGIKCNVDLTILENGKKLRTEYGQILFADYGLSGPPVFQLSSLVNENSQNQSFAVDFMPEFSYQQTLENLQKIVKNPFCENLTTADLLLPMINKKVGQIVIKYCGLPLNISAKDLSEKQIKSIASALKNMEIKILSTKGFQNAQVTFGGVKTCEFDEFSMQSKLCQGLFACGEVLDITGDCGGYNLQWAFSSGVLAGKAATEC